jgi:putative peptidoglycan lipid II flippase
VIKDEPEEKPTDPHPPERHGELAPSSRQVTRSAGLVGLLTLTSRLAGLARDTLMAARFSAAATDAFFVAQTLPNVLRRLLAEGALAGAFVPIFAEYRVQRSPCEARGLLARTLGAALLVQLLLTALSFTTAPFVVKLVAYGLSRRPAQLDLAVDLTRIVSLFIVPMGLTGLAACTLNTLGRFAAPAAAPLVLNLCIIAMVLLGADRMVRLGMPPAAALGWGMVAGGLAHLLLQLPFLSRERFLVLPRFGLADPGLARVGKLLLPALLGLLVYEGYVVLGRQLASLLPEGSISCLYYSSRMVDLPLGIVAAAMATASLPSLATHAAAGDEEQVRRIFRTALRTALFIVIPASTGLVALAWPLTSVLFQRGQFSPDMARTTAMTLIGLAGGGVAGAGIRLTIVVFHALQDTRTPVKVAALSLVLYTVAAVTLVGPLGTVGLAIAVSASTTANFFLLLLLLRRRLGPLGLGEVARSGLRSSAAALACGLVARLIVARPAASPVRLVLAVGAGGLVFVAISRWLGAGELAELWRDLSLLRRRRDRPERP